MKSINLKRELPIIIIMMSSIVYLFIMWKNVPDQIPMQWNLSGEVSSYGSKITPAILLLFVYMVLFFSPKLDPRKKNYELFSGSYYKLRLSLILFLSLIYTLTIYNSIYNTLNLANLIPIMVFALFAVMGNYMTTLRPNYFIGIRTPWTLENEEVWKKTHRLGGRLCFVGSLLGIVLSLFLSTTDYQYTLLFLIISIVTIIPVIYSYVSYKHLKKVAHS